jgi:TetR/AcrR family transcriptional repressor of mexJK operon
MAKADMTPPTRRTSRPGTGGKASTGASARPNRKTGVILSAARELFLERGFDTITMDMVTRASGVSKATLYVHFNSKEELFSAVLSEEALRITDEIWQSAQDEADEKGDIEAVLRCVARNFVDVFLTERAMVLRRAVIGALPHFPAMGRAIFESGPRILNDRLARVLGAAHDRGELCVPDPDLAARQFLGLIRGDIDLRGLLALELPSPAEIDRQAEAAIALFMHFYSGSERKP